MNIDEVIRLLTWIVTNRQGWTFAVDDGCIHLYNVAFEKTIFSPLTAVYYDLTGRAIHRGSYWAEELCWEFGLKWQDALVISHASTSCNCDSVVGRGYCQKTRDKMLLALGLLK